MPIASPQRYHCIPQALRVVPILPPATWWLSTFAAARLAALEPARSFRRPSMRSGRRPRATRSRLIQPKRVLSNELGALADVELAVAPDVAANAGAGNPAPAMARRPASARETSRANGDVVRW